MVCPWGVWGEEHQIGVAEGVGGGAGDVADAVGEGTLYLEGWRMFSCENMHVYVRLCEWEKSVSERE